MNYYVYIVTNKTNGVVYTGVTNNLDRRIKEHKSKISDGFTKRYNLTKLVYFDQFSRIEDAIRAEKMIKGWKRDKKNNLIRSINPEWTELDPSAELQDDKALK